MLTLSAEESDFLIAKDARNADVLFPYVNGDDLNNRPDSSGSRWIINFFDWSEERAMSYPDCYQIVLRTVKPAREKVRHSEHARVNWWMYERVRTALYAAMANLSHVMAIAQTSNVLMPVKIPTGSVLDQTIIVFPTEDMADFALLSSAPHYWWAISRGTTLGAGLRYTPSAISETLPRPAKDEGMRKAGADLFETRNSFVLDRQLGLTKTSNLIHDPNIQDNEVARLRALHVETDAAVCAAYGWDDIPLEHDHYETRQGLRWTVSPAARLELVDRLLELNHSRYAEEQAASGTSPVKRKGRRRTNAQPTEGTLFDTDEDS